MWSYREHETKNKGTFLANIELSSKYDPVFSELLQKPKESIKYLSCSIQNKIIISLNKKVKFNTLQELEKFRF